MKNLDLNAHSVEKMNITEMKTIEGGYAGILPLFEVIYQDGFIKEIWYSEEHGQYVTNSSTWIGCA
jgi:hypothetical protein